MNPAPSDQESRDLARFELGKNVVVEAGAGTGKTTLLTDRLLTTVLAGGPERRGLPIERIVALTFTEKAAGEIKDRLALGLEDLLAVLQGGASALPQFRRERAESRLAEVEKRFALSQDQARKTAEQALQSLDRALIGTLHHFAARVLRRHPLEAGVDPAFTVDEGDRFQALFDEQWALWLDTELGAQAPRREDWLEVLAHARLEDIEALARALSSPKISLERLHAGPEQKESLARLRAELLRVPDGKQSKRKVKLEDQIPAIARALEALEAGSSALPRRVGENGFGTLSWPQSWGEEDEFKTVKRAERVARVTPEADLLVRKAAALVAPFVRQFRAAFARRGWIGFDGLLAAARDLVRDDVSVRRALRREFSAFLIDEFQDTDPLQGETLLFLGETPGGTARDWRELEFEPGRLFVVGDPKQSIYQFRGADIRAYADFTQLLEKKGALRCALRANFRSAAPILDTVNAAFSNLMRSEAGLQPEYASLLPGPRAAGDGGVRVLLAGGDGGAVLSAEQAQQAEAAAVARWLAENAGPEGSGRPHRYRDVAVLLRSASPLAAYVEALKAAGVPYVIEAERFFYETQEVTDFLNLLRVLDDPSDRASLAGLLRSPLAALDDRELLALSRDLDYRREPPSEGLPPSGHARASALFSLLRELRAGVGRGPLEELVHDILSRTFLLELSAAAYHGDQTVSNLFKFARLAAARGDSEGHTLKEYIAAIEREASDERGGEGESPLADERYDAVRVLTIHKAKGLEWPVVFLPNLTSPAGKNSGSLDACLWDPRQGRAGLCLPKDRRKDLAYALFEEAKRLREEKESVRLLYVAMTRAKEKLFLLGNGASGRVIPEGAFAAMLREAGLWPDKDGAAKSLPVDRFEAASAPAHPAEAVPRLEADGAALGRLWKRRRRERDEVQSTPVFISPSASEPFEKRIPPPADDAEAAPAALVGQLCHYVLERWDYRAQGDLDVALDRACAALLPVFSGADAGLSRAEARAVLSGFLNSDAARELAGARILARELPLVYGEGWSVVRGSLDLLYERDGKLVVADYKTDHVKGDWVAHAERYRGQGEHYVKAVEKATGREASFHVIFLRGGRRVPLIS